MARPLRIHVVDAWYHVMSRRNGGETLFRRYDDRRAFLGFVSELPERVTVMGIGDGVVAVGTRHLWWRLAEAAVNMPWVKYGSLAQGLRRLWRLAEERGELKELVAGMWDKCK